MGVAQALFGPKSYHRYSETDKQINVWLSDIYDI